MRKIRGFLLKHRVTTVFRRLFRRKRSPAGYIRLDPSRDAITKPKPFCKLLTHIKTKAKSICSASKKPGRVNMYEGQEKGQAVPKGHMAVYVGQNDGDFSRVFVPVIYFNHPLFGELLREAEEEYGYNHPGGITIPCRISEFERVKSRIAAGHSARKKLTWN